MARSQLNLSSRPLWLRPSMILRCHLAFEFGNGADTRHGSKFYFTLVNPCSQSLIVALISEVTRSRLEVPSLTATLTGYITLGLNNNFVPNYILHRCSEIWACRSPISGDMANGWVSGMQTWNPISLSLYAYFERPCLFCMSAIKNLKMS